MDAASSAAPTLRRDVRVIGLIGFAHLFSHLFQLALAPLFVMIRSDTGFSFTALGTLVGLFYLASAAFQTPAGFLVDRFGARRVLFGGLGLMCLTIIGYGLLPWYPAMVVLAVLSGIGNSVFHPADYSILSATVSEGRIGRGFSMHNFFGFIGFGSAPFVMIGLGDAWGWRTALIIVGVAGLAALFAVMAGSGDFRDSTDERADAAGGDETLGAGLSVLLKTPILLCFGFFLLVAMGQIGLQNFSPTVLASHFNFAQWIASGSITAMLFGAPVGILIGGVIADRTDRHEGAISLSFLFAASMILLAGFGGLPAGGVIAVYALAGIAYGIAFPSRDVLVRSIAPRGGTGKVFGFVYSGLDVGSSVTPILFGWFVDHGMPTAIFAVVAGLWLVSITVVLATGRAVRRAAG